MKVDHCFINGKRFDIKQDDYSNLGVLGQAWYGTQEIRICSTSKPPIKAQTLLHELMHMFDNEYLGEHDRLSEAQIIAMVAALIAFLRENAHINLYTLIAEGLE